MKTWKFQKQEQHSRMDVESTVTLHNLFFLVRMLLLANIFVKTFDWLSYRKKCVFVQVQGQNSEQKHATKKHVEFHNHLHI